VALPIQPRDLLQRKTQREHLALAAALPLGVLRDIQALAAQLHDKPVLPIIGAGASYDCGVKLASRIGRDLYVEYTTDPSFAPRAEGVVEDNLGNVAEAIAQKIGQLGAVRGIGLHLASHWPDMDAMDEHYCAYRPLARLVREVNVGEALTFNYDCGYEAALKAEGLRRGGWSTALGQDFDDHLTVIADAATNNQLARRGFTVFKPHGCAERFRVLEPADPHGAAEIIVIRESQLTHWRDANWMRDQLRSSARHSVVLLLGFSAADPVIVGELLGVFGEIYNDLAPDGIPRVVAIDRAPNTPRLVNLINAGLGGQSPGPGMITAIPTTDDGSLSAILTLLLTETLAVKLADHLGGLSLYTDLEPRMSELTVSAPVMLRWSYLLRGRGEHQWAQRVNLLEAARRGYVPLTHDPPATIRLLRARRMLRELLGETAPETLDEALADAAFVTRGAHGYLPVDVDRDELEGMSRPGGEAARIAAMLGAPGLEIVLLSARSDMTSGFHIQTGSEVKLP